MPPTIITKEEGEQSSCPDTIITFITPSIRFSRAASILRKLFPRFLTAVPFRDPPSLSLAPETSRPKKKRRQQLLSR